jgi:hypothetical protein
VAPKEAYELIRRAIAIDAGKRLVGSRYDDQNFGNFIISFEEDGGSSSIGNDRGELVRCEGIDGSGPCTTVLLSIRDADEEAVLAALGLSGR